MSGQAMHRVILHGPDDPHLFRLLIVVADHMDTAGVDGWCGQREMAGRVRVGIHRVRRLLAEAVRDGWLAVEKAGGPRKQAIYRLGPALSSPVRNGNAALSDQQRSVAAPRTNQKQIRRDSPYEPATLTSTVLDVRQDDALPPKGGVVLTPAAQPFRPDFAAAKAAIPKGRRR